MDEKRGEQLQEAQAVGKLPLRAEALLRILKRKIGKNAHCWHTQEVLAKELGVGRRQFQHWVAYLLKAGLIQVDFMSHSKSSKPRNHYSLTTLGASVLDARISAPLDARISAPLDARISAPLDARISAPLPPAPLDELDFSEGESLKAPRTTPPCAQEEEHPLVAKQLANVRAFDALPEDAKQRIEAIVRAESPNLFGMSSSADYDFRVQCVAVMVERAKERPFLEFKRTFIRRIGIKGDTSYIDDWEPSFTKISATLAEMLDGLDVYIDDPRRDNQHWQGRFPRLAKKPIISNILSSRRIASAEAQRGQRAVPAPFGHSPARARNNAPDLARSTMLSRRTISRHRRRFIG